MTASNSNHTNRPCDLERDKTLSAPMSQSEILICHRFLIGSRGSVSAASRSGLLSWNTRHSEEKKPRLSSISCEIINKTRRCQTETLKYRVLQLNYCEENVFFFLLLFLLLHRLFLCLPHQTINGIIFPPLPHGSLCNITLKYGGEWGMVVVGVGGCLSWCLECQTFPSESNITRSRPLNATQPCSDSPYMIGP